MPLVRTTPIWKGVYYFVLVYPFPLATVQHLTVESSTKQLTPWIKNGTQSFCVFIIIVVCYGIGQWTSSAVPWVHI